MTVVCKFDIHIFKHICNCTYLIIKRYFFVFLISTSQTVLYFCQVLLYSHFHRRSIDAFYLYFAIKRFSFPFRFAVFFLMRLNFPGFQQLPCMTDGSFPLGNGLVPILIEYVYWLAYSRDLDITRYLVINSCQVINSSNIFLVHYPLSIFLVATDVQLVRWWCSTCCNLS